MFTPEDIQGREFLVSLRGYDRAEVRAFLTEVAGQVRELQTRIQAVEDRMNATPAVVEEREARPAPSEAEEMFFDIGPETQRILEAAREAALTIARKARVDADRQVQSGRRQAARLIAEGEQRREEAEEVVAGLEAARVALSQQLREIAGTVDRVINELASPPVPTATVREALTAGLAVPEEPTKPAARSAEPATAPLAVAESTLPEPEKPEPEPAPEPEPEKPEPEPEPEADGDEQPELEAEREAQADADEQPELEPEREAQADADEEPEPEAEREAQADADEQPEPDARLEADPVSDAESDPEADSGALAESEPALLQADPVRHPGPVQEPDLGPEPEPEPPPAPRPEQDPTPLPGPDPQPTPLPGPEPAPEPAPEPEPAPAPEPEPAPAPEPEPAPAPEPEPAPLPGPVAGLESEPEPAATVAEVGALDESGEDPADPHGLRGSALEPLRPDLVRAIKRGLQEAQNVALDRLRRTGGEAEPESLVGEEIETIGTAGVAPLRAAYEAGLDVASLLVDRDLPVPESERELTEAFLADVLERVRKPLAATLRMARSTGEEPALWSDRVSAVFAELKSSTAQELAVTHLLRAYELGLLDAWTAGGVTHRRWVLGREPRCPEARCRHNSQAGVVAIGAAYPSGHDVPPVHIGCTCTTIPISEPPS